MTDERFDERIEVLGSGQATQASRSSMGRRPAGFVTWIDSSAAGDPVLHEEAYGIARLREGDWVLRLTLTTPGGETTAQEPTEQLETILAEVGSTKIRRHDGEQSDWYGERFKWDAPWNYNPWFSIASSLAFAVSMLALAWWRLKRIDF